jgi:hypothetical protein
MKWEESDMQPPDAVEGGKTYDATVVSAEEKISQKGNPYINLKLAVYVTPDKPVTLYTAVMVAFPPKLKAFCLSAGLYKQWAAQELHYSECGNHSCRVVISKTKNEKGYFEIDTFEVPSDAEAKIAKAKEELAAGAGSVVGDEVPF